MGNIHLLPDSLVNQIAAGEVIERPASVVKELLENALDAGAKRIVVHLEDGGRKLIRVTDDGVGMSADDLAMSLEPHATSKISNQDDLFAIATLGFRGEALPSIASVANVRMVTRPADRDAASELCISGGDRQEVRAAAAPVGTTVEVRDLFFNVPARRKFIRGANTELGHTVEHVARVALAHPAVGLELTHNGRTVHHLDAGGSLLGRIAELYGRELADSLLKVAGERGRLTITGFAAPPARARSAAKWQFSFVNGRFVRDRFIQHALKEAFRGLIEPSRYPVAFLYLAADPSGFDVNVHPTKIEVRWQDSNLVHSTVLAALRDTLLGSDLTPALETPQAVDESTRVRGQQVRQAIADFFKQSGPTQRRMEFSPGAARGGAGGVAAHARPTPAETTDGPEPSAWAAGATSGAPGRDLQPESRVPARAIQVHNAYLVAETEDGLVIIDQHALHERIMYERLSERITHGALETQRLLLPESVPVTARQTALLAEHEQLLARLGLEVAPFGSGTVAVHAFPSLLSGVEPAAFLNDLLDKLSDKGSREHPESLLQEIVEMMACKAAVKAGDYLNAEEIESLMAQRNTVEKSSNCPHGRPTTLRLTLDDLERQFKRV